MNTFIIYLLEVSICFALFYLVYFLFKGDTFYYLKRFYLVFTVLISIIIPQLSSPNLPVDIEQLIIIEPTQDVSNITFQDTFEKVVFGQIPENIFTPESNFFDLLSLLVLFYLIGVLYFLYRLLRNFFHIFYLYKQNEKENYQNFKVVLLPENYPTFSFFNFIFLNNKNLSDRDKNDIILHEIVHVKQRHSIDILFIEICRILFWFNPIIWFYKSSIVKVHECLADQYFVENRPENIVEYQSLLLKQYLSKIHIELAHPFNYSLIKYRIKMMTKNKSKWWTKYKLIFALPIIVIGLIAFSNADLSLDEKTNKQNDYFEPNPMGMVFIPQGSFTLNRTNGNITKEFEVSIDPFWMKETEVRVEEYLNYLESLRKDSAKQVYEEALPNIDKVPFKGYYVNEEYKNYPMVGVSLIQAQDFCKWKTSQENQKLKSEGKHLVADYRIPSEIEWVFASFGGLKPNEITKPVNPGIIEIKRGKTIKKDRNEFGLIYMFSNVSEWTYTAYKPEEYLNNIQNYPDENTDNVVVRGDNYKKDLINDKLILSGNKSYEYVGFRYVRSYLGSQNY
jgi:formylglycine-generating enzyme required for sulfatase activity